MIDPKKIEQIARQVHESMPKGIREFGEDVEKKIRRMGICFRRIENQRKQDCQESSMWSNTAICHDLVKASEDTGN